MFKRSKVNAGVVLALGGALLSSSSLVLAQDSQRVEITGSRLNRINLDSPTPTLVLDASSFSNLGIENFADLAQQLPQFAPAFGASRTQSTFSGVASSGLNLTNLRNLGGFRTLVLINGRRVPGGTSTSSSVDFNTIPTANIERIEIITGGASAVYGSDAVSGVINIITKKNFSGIEVGASYGEASAGDNKNPSAHIMVGGKIGERGNGLLTLQVDNQGQVSCKDRYICAEDFAWTNPASPLRGPAAYSGVGLGGRFFVGGTSYTRRNGSFTDANGNLYPFSVTIDGYNRNADRDIAIPTKRIVAAGEVEAEITKGVKAFAEMNYGQAKIDSAFEGHPFQSQAAGSLFGSLQPTIPMSNPFIPAALRAAVDAYNANPANANTQITNMTWWQRFNEAGGPRGAASDRNTVRLAAGLKGELDTLFGLGKAWRWELSHVYGRTQVNLNTEGLVNTSNLYYGLRVEPDPANPGKFRCSDAGARSQGCVPINPFADYTPEMQAALRIGSQASGRSTIDDTVASISGVVGELPAGSVRTAFGLERRTFSGFLDYDVVVNNGLATGNRISDIEKNKSTTEEAFAEVLVPILADVPGAKSLNFEGAFRTSKADKFDYNTWKFGGDWEPVGGVRVRAMKARSVRAPLPGELSGGGLTAGVVNDPCTAARRTQNATRAANCDADGVPSNYTPALTIEQGVTGQTGGNPNLEPEVGTTLTYGVVWTPAFAKGLSVSIDRFKIDVDKIITTVSRQIAVNKCYDTVERLLCNAVTRGTNPLLPGANYVLTSVNEQLQNVASQSIAGVDIDVRYGFRLPSSLGSVDLSWVNTIYDKAKLVPLAGNDPINLLGQAGGSTSDQGYVRHTSNLSTTWKWNRLSTNWTMRYISRSDMDPSSSADGYPKIGAHTYHNLRVGYSVAKDSEVFAGVTNVFDKQPPFFGSGRSGTQALDTVPGYYDVFGRSWYVGLRAKF